LSTDLFATLSQMEL